MVKAAYILLTHETDPQALESPLYEAAVNALADLAAELETKNDVRDYLHACINDGNGLPAIHVVHADDFEGVENIAAPFVITFADGAQK